MPLTHADCLQDYLAKDGVLRLSLHSGKFAVPLGSHADKQTGRMDRVQGRGDGSFISPKFTGIAAFCGSDARHRYNVKVLRAAVHSFGKTAVRWPCVGLQEVPRASHRTGGWCAVLCRAPRVVWVSSSVWANET